MVQGSTAEKAYAIVCDNGCDLSHEALERLGVVPAMFHVEMAGSGSGQLTDLDVEAAYAVLSDGHLKFTVAAPRVDELMVLYRDLASRGYEDIISVHVTAAVSGVVDAARAAAEGVSHDAHVIVVDSESGSVAAGIVVAGTAEARECGASFDEAVDVARSLAHGVRLLFVPTPATRPVRRVRRGRVSILGHADNLRIRLAGERGLFTLAHGALSEVVRSSDITDLTGRIAHAMSAMSRDEGPLCYVEVDTGARHAISQLEKHLDTNEFESRCLCARRANPCVAVYAGVGAVGIAVVPQALLDGFVIGTHKGLALDGMIDQISVSRRYS